MNITNICGVLLIDNFFCVLLDEIASICTQNGQIVFRLKNNQISTFRKKPEGNIIQSSEEDQELIECFEAIRDAWVLNMANQTNVNLVYTQSLINKHNKTEEQNETTINSRRDR